MSRWPKALRIALWVVGGLTALLLVAVALLAISIAVDGRGSAERLAQVTNTTIPGGTGPDVPAYVATPPGPGPHPTVIMIHEFWGLNPDIVSKADLLAQEGYLVVAPNVFRGSATGYLPRAIYQVVSTPVEEVNEDIDAVIAWIEDWPSADSGRVGITGFCFGGRTSLLYSLHNPTLRATSVFYGEPVTDAERLGTLTGPVLGIFGGADTSIPLENVRGFERALIEANVESTVTVYADQPHAFVKNAEGIASDPVQAQAWNEMVRFLEGALEKGRSNSSASSPAVPVSDFYGWVPIVRLALGHGAHPSPWAAGAQAHPPSH